MNDKDILNIMEDVIKYYVPTATVSMDNRDLVFKNGDKQEVLEYFNEETLFGWKFGIKKLKLAEIVENIK